MKKMYTVFLVVIALIIIFFNVFKTSTLNASTTNVLSSNFSEELERIVKKTGVSSNCKVESYILEFDGQTGIIKKINFRLIDASYLYNINYIPYEKQFSIDRINIKNSGVKNMKLNATRLFKILDQINYSSILNTKKSDYYTLIGNSELKLRTANLNPPKEIIKIEKENKFNIISPNQKMEAFEMNLHGRKKILQSYWFN